MKTFTVPGKLDSKHQYQFLGSYNVPALQQLYYTTKLPQYYHFLWNDIQLSKGKVNKDRKIEVVINGESENVFYWSAPCNGVKRCSVLDCPYIVPVCEK